jgi:capsular polysaccharide transport system permease protein
MSNEPSESAKSPSEQPPASVAISAKAARRAARRAAREGNDTMDAQAAREDGLAESDRRQARKERLARRQQLRLVKSSLTDNSQDPDGTTTSATRQLQAERLAMWRAKRAERRARKQARGRTAKSGGEQVETFNKPLRAAKPRRGLTRQGRSLLMAALVMVALPTLASAVYLTQWATPQYASEIKFAVRGPESTRRASGGGGAGGTSSASTSTSAGGASAGREQASTRKPDAGIDTLSTITGMTQANPLSLVSDSYIVADYINSREMVERLEPLIRLRERYSRPEIDYFSRFDKSQPVELLAKYWQGKITTAYDNSTGLVTVEVRAFSAQDAYDIAAGVLQVSSAMVNQLSEKVQNDALRAAEDDVHRSEQRVQEVRSQLRKFRDREQVADPLASATAKQTMLVSLAGQLAQINAALSQRRGVDESSPTVMTLRARAEAIEREIARARAELGSDDANTAATIVKALGSYEELDVQRQFAEQSLVSALTSLETARSAADRLRRYLAVHREPKLPEYPLYPHVLEFIALTFLGSALLFGLVVLGYRGVRGTLRS